MAQIIAQMSVLSEAGASHLGDVVRGGEPSNAPKGPRLSLADWHREAWRRKPTTETLEAAEADLRQARFSKYKKHQFVNGTLEQRIAIANEPGRVADVAEKFGCSVRHVYNMRKISRSR